ncbi:hypothetical protein HU200_012923 [Digitaria exilis]|uniref:Formamidase n=1 Tax=Digitaria exilis TaxID=1010633 RepID=A0A835FFF5_9POAL|nr:hypothetical protein HU200_012923 [Digitaria exilis]
MKHGSSDPKTGSAHRSEEASMGQKVPLHNRWHPDIPPVADVTEGELFRVEMVDWSGGRVRDDNSADDMKCMDFTIKLASKSKVYLLHRWSKCHVCNEYNVMQIQEGTAEWHKIANEAARTIAGRENGGNCDIKNLSRGSKVYLPVFVEGANLSTGDMHFSQGDGEISLCGAIEMSGFLELK